MKKLHFVTDKSQTQRGVQLKDGRIISLYDKDNVLKTYIFLNNINYMISFKG